MDVCPVSLTLADGTKHRRTKARIDGTGVTVWAWDPEAQEGVVVYQSPEVEQTGPKAWRSGDVTMTSCGCSNGGPLKRWRPPAGNVAVATPAEAS